jgi:NADPH-dependent F420 reductase
MEPRAKVAVMGGTGPLGRGLALRWAAAGLEVTVGSRSADRAAREAEALAERLRAIGRGRAPRGAENAVAAAEADVIVLAVPFEAQAATLEEIRRAIEGKVLIDAAVPLDPREMWRVELPGAGSAAAEAQAQLGDRVRVVCAFQNVAASRLWNLDVEIDCDVLVCGNDADAKRIALELVEAAGLRGFDAGPLDNAGVIDGLTSILGWLNRRFKVHDAGVRITGVSR